MVSALLTAGAWISSLAAVFLLGRFGQLFSGLAFVAAAAFGSYAAERLRGAAHMFAGQLSLAFSLLGKWLVVCGLVSLLRLRAGGEVFVLTAVVAAAGYPIFRQRLDRLLSVLAALCCGVFWALEGLNWGPFYMETLSVVLFAAAYVLLIRNRERAWPFAWALLGACAFAAFLNLSGVSRWIGGMHGLQAGVFGGFNNLLAGVFLCAMYVWVARKKGSLPAAVSVLVLSFISNTGTAMGAALLCLGMAQNRPVLKTAGIGALAGSLFWLYYHMDVTLLAKAGYLCAAGLILLGAYAWLKRGNYAR